MRKGNIDGASSGISMGLRLCHSLVRFVLYSAIQAQRKNILCNVLLPFAILHKGATQQKITDDSKAHSQNLFFQFFSLHLFHNTILHRPIHQK
jgi:hypothetical protein